MMWNFEQYSTNTALTDESGVSISYGDLKNEAEKLSSFIGKRCLVFSLCKNSIGSVIGYVSFIRGGIVPVLLSEQMDKELLDKLVSQYCPEYLWIPTVQLEQFKDMRCVHKAFDYSLVKTDYEYEYPLYDELALLLTTSGSTGSPKLVRQSYENIFHNTMAIVDYLNLHEGEKPITTLPMNYTYGLSVINSHLMVGANILLTEKSIVQKEFWHFFREQGATSLAGVPYTYEILERIRFTRMNLPSLKMMTQAGGKLSLELHEKLAMYAMEKGIKFFVMYGQCEATARMGYLPAEMAVAKKGSMGVAIPDGKFYIVDEDGKEVTQPGITGELVYEGKNVTLGYAQSGADLIKGDERNGVLVTGDMAKFDEEGYYYIVGRKKRFLKIYGNRVNLDEIDNIIRERFSVESASTGIDDHMYIYITDESMADEIKEYVVLKTKLNSVAFKVRIVEEIPKNEAGKILYSKLDGLHEWCTEE